MLWTLRPWSRSLPLMVTAWILLSLILCLIYGLVKLRQVRKVNRELEKLIALSKESPARARIPLVTRVK